MRLRRALFTGPLFARDAGRRETTGEPALLAGAAGGEIVRDPGCGQARTNDQREGGHSRFAEGDGGGAEGECTDETCPMVDVERMEAATPLGEEGEDGGEEERGEDENEREVHTVTDGGGAGPSIHRHNR